MTTRLQKGGALLPDMRQLVVAACNNPDVAISEDAARQALTKASLARVHDTYIRAFRPRFVEGSPREAWKLAAQIERHSPDIDVVRPFYYWVTARAEPLLYQFVTTELFARRGAADREVRIGETLAWIHSRLESAGKTWSPTVQRKVARGLLAALRDFGILEGTTRKRLAPFQLSLEAFAVIAFLLDRSVERSAPLVSHPDWRLFLLLESSVERMLLECHQRRWLDYQVAGAIHRIEFATADYKEYVRGILERRT